MVQCRLLVVHNTQVAVLEDSMVPVDLLEVMVRKGIANHSR